MVLHCGSPDGARHGQLNIYEESLAAGKPPRVVPLHLVHNVQSLNTTHPSVPEMGTSLFRMSMTDSLQPASLWGFMLLLQTGEGVELYAEAREEQQLWIRHLNLLSTYPYSPIPEEPRVCPIKEKFRARLNPANFDAGEESLCVELKSIIVIVLCTIQCKLHCSGNLPIQYATLVCLSRTTL